MTQLTNLAVNEPWRPTRLLSASWMLGLLKASVVAGTFLVVLGNSGWAQQFGSARARLAECDRLPLACDDPGIMSLYPVPPGSPPRPPTDDPFDRTETGEAAARAPAAQEQPDDGLAPALETDADGLLGDFDSSAFSLDSNLASAGVQRGNFSAAPTMTGDLFGAGLLQLSAAQRFEFREVMSGFILNQQPGGSPDALLGFGLNRSQIDIFTTGSGIDTTGDQNADQFSLLEPIPPSGALTSPGPGFVFDGGTAIFLGDDPSATTPQGGQFEDGDDWLVAYSFSQRLGIDVPPIILAGPDVATRRVKLSENFSPEVRDRYFMNYSYFNNALGGLGDVNRWVLGIERILIDDLVSIELRQPMATTLGSRQQIDAPGNRSYELGNLTAVGKIVMYRDHRWIWTSGMGVTAPLADDARLMRGNETLLRIRNQSVHLLPFAAVLMRYDQDTIFQAFTQLDVDSNGNEIRGNLAGGPLPVLGRLRDSTLLHLDASVHRTLVRRPRTRLVREVIGNAELHYTGSLENADVVSGNSITVTDLSRRFNVVNATFSSHWLMGDNVVMTPGISVPMQGGLNRQFNYEAILQLNYLR